jgi:hypothetical protein
MNFVLIFGIIKACFSLFDGHGPIVFVSVEFGINLIVFWFPSLLWRQLWDDVYNLEV